MLKTLGDMYDAPPGIPPVFTKPPCDGWLYPEVADMLAAELGEETRVIVEVGSWLGKSARHMLDHAPNAVIYCVDTWNGSPEHGRLLGYNHDRIIATLYERFVDACWEYRARVYPLRCRSAEGLPTLLACGVEPDVCYIDGSHVYDDVLRDLTDCVGFWPGVRVMGDDYHESWPDVVRAVNVCRDGTGRRLRVCGRGWVLDP